MAAIPSIGDILSLSQLSLKNARAFSAGRRADTPQEFVDVETEITALSKVLKKLAESLFADGSILSKADPGAQANVASMFHACERTLQDIESLLEQYQVVERSQASGAYKIGRSWSEDTLNNYGAIRWTTDGKDIHALHKILEVHRSVITLILQAVQSKSLSKLEETVTSVAPRIERINGSAPGEVDDRLEQEHRIVTAIAHGVPAVRPLRPRAPQPLTLSPADAIPSGNRDILNFDSPATPMSARRHSNPPISLSSGYPHSPLKTFYARRPSLPPTPQEVPEDREIDASSIGSATKVGSVSLSPYLSPQGTEITDAASFWSFSGSETPGQRSADWKARRLGMAIDQFSMAGSESTLINGNESRSMSQSSYSFSPLPPPAITEDPPYAALEKTRSVLRKSQLSPNLAVGSKQRAQEAFEKRLCRNSAELCDGRGWSVEYSAPSAPEMGLERPANVRMATAMEDCRICILRKREGSPDGSFQITTNIWALSEDGNTRMQQTLIDGEEIVPYVSYFSPEKVSVTVATKLKFYPLTYGSPPTEIIKTNWVNYYFKDIKSAEAFQSVLMGNTLLATYKTDKTVRVHEGLTGVLAYQEQMCGMEVLRLWREDASNAIVVMIHYSAQFRTGYMTFQLNSTKTPVRVKDEGGTVVKVKGLNIPSSTEENGGGSSGAAAGTRSGRRAQRTETGPQPVKLEENARSGRSPRRDGKKTISAIRIDFTTEEDKSAFLDRVKRVQDHTVPVSEV